MADIEKYGRTFTFDDDVSEAQRDARIQNWMRQHAPDELEKPKAKPITAAMAPVVERDTPKTDETPKSPSKDNKALRFLSSVLLGPWAPIVGMSESGRKAMGDVNTYRTLAQGALPYADEITAGVRSLAGTPYDTALAEERQGVKDFGDEYGEGAKTALELTGALGTIPIGLGVAGAAARAVPGGAKLAQLVARHPWLAASLGGATTGGIMGFGAGEGGAGDRAENALTSAGVGAALGPAVRAGVKAAQKGTAWLNTDSRVANYLREVIGREKKIDTDSPTFIPDAMRRLRGEMAEQQRLGTDPRVADLLPDATEAALLKPGRGSSELAESLYKRQYDPELARMHPNTARQIGQHGRVEDAFDQAFGPDLFQLTDDALLAQRRANAQRGYAPAYAQNVRSADIDDAMDRLNTLNPNILATAQRWAAAERRPIGTFHPDGTIDQYNTQYLHDIKRSMDEVLGEQGRMNPRFNQVPYNNAKSDLNTAIMDVNPEYRAAMTQYGDDSALIEALRRGREDVFVPGSVDRTGAMDDDAIRSYLADTNIPQAAKDLFLAGAARALRQNVLASQSKKLTHNWADILSNPEYEKRIGALMNGRQLGAWDLFRGRLRQESQNYKNVARATGNSRTAAREALKAEVEGAEPDAMAALGLLINPKAPSGWRGLGSTLLRHVDPANATMNKTASILARRGPAGTAAGLDDIERLLQEVDARNERFRRLGNYAPIFGSGSAYTSPSRKD